MRALYTQDVEGLDRRKAELEAILTTSLVPAYRSARQHLTDLNAAVIELAKAAKEATGDH